MSGPTSREFPNEAARHRERLAYNERQKLYMREYRKTGPQYKEKVITQDGWVLWPLEPRVALQTFAKNRKACEAKCYLARGITPKQAGLEVRAATLTLTVDQKPIKEKK